MGGKWCWKNMHTSGFLWERAWKEGTERKHGAWNCAGVVHPVLSVLSLLSQPSVRRDLTGVLVYPPSMRKRQAASSLVSSTFPDTSCSPVPVVVVVVMCY
jgi:hypothetical protein